MILHNKADLAEYLILPEQETVQISHVSPQLARTLQLVLLFCCCSNVTKYTSYIIDSEKKLGKDYHHLLREQAVKKLT